MVDPHPTYSVGWGLTCGFGCLINLVNHKITGRVTCHLPGKLKPSKKAWKTSNFSRNSQTDTNTSCIHLSSRSGEVTQCCWVPAIINKGLLWHEISDILSTFCSTITCLSDRHQSSNARVPGGTYVPGWHLCIMYGSNYKILLYLDIVSIWWCLYFKLDCICVTYYILHNLNTRVF